MKCASIISIVAVAYTSLVHADSSNTDKCLSKPEATAYINEFSKVLSQSKPDWEVLAAKVVTEDFALKSGSALSTHGGSVGNGDAIRTRTRAEWIAALKRLGAFIEIQSEEIQVAGCNTIFWQFRRQSAGKTVLHIERFDLRFTKGRWAAYQSQVEFDSCAAIGGCTGVTKRDSNSNSNENSGKYINKAEATSFVSEFAKVWFRSVPDWEARALKIATPDFQLISGAAISLKGQTVGSGRPVALASRAAWIQNLKDYAPPTNLQTEHIVVDADSNIIFWQYRGRRNGKNILFIERFDVRHTGGRWVTYRTDVEFDSCAFNGGPCQAASG